MQINPLMAGVAVSVLVLSVVAVKTGNDSKALHPEQVSVAAAATAKPILKPCAECGVIVGIRQVDMVSGFVGAVFGHETSGGKDGGAAAKANDKRYEIQVRMSDGSVKTLTSGTQPIWKPGDRVRLQHGKLVG